MVNRLRHQHDGQLLAWLLAGYPISWALGLGLIHHAIFAAAMVVWLTAHRPLRVNRGTGLLGLFLVVATISIVGLDSFGSAAISGLRLTWYASAFIAWVYLARHRGPGPRDLVVKSLIGLWALVVAGGWLSVLAPELSWSSPLVRIIPAALGDNDLIARFLNPATSETQVFRYLDVVLHRPAAPFAYTNGWGSAVALLTPFALAGLHDRRIGVSRGLLVAGLLASLVPLTEALNRGSWLTLTVGLVYAAVRWAWIRRDPRPAALLVVVAVAGLAIASMTGAVGQAADALATRSEDSNETRSGLYIETLARSADSPLIGHGSTRPSVENPDGPPLGTHGQLWAVLFAHGYLGAALYVGFFVAAFLRARAHEPIQHWAKVSLLVGLLQLPIYGHLPHQLFIMVTAAGVAMWPSTGWRQGAKTWPAKSAGRSAGPADLLVTAAPEPAAATRS